MKKISLLFRNIQLLLGMISISIFFITIIIQVLARYSKITVVWTGEVSTYSFIWFVFMGAGVMAFEEKHFSFSFLIDKLQSRYKIYLKILAQVVIFIFSVAVLYYGIEISNKFWNYRWINLPFVKMGYTWLCLPIFGISSSIYSFLNIINNIKDIKKNRLEHQS